MWEHQVGARACPGLDAEVRFLMSIPGSLRGCRGARTGLGTGCRERAVPPAPSPWQGARCLHQPGEKAAPVFLMQRTSLPTCCWSTLRQALRARGGAVPPQAFPGLPNVCLHSNGQAVVCPGR